MRQERGELARARSGTTSRDRFAAGAYIAQCFRWAHDADPEALLVLQRGRGRSHQSASRTPCMRWSAIFEATGVPIDGVGFQMHISNLHLDVASISRNIDTVHRTWTASTHHRIGCRASRRREWQCANPEDLHAQADVYRADRIRVSGSCRLQRNSDLGLYRQIFVDRIVTPSTLREQRCFSIAIISPSRPMKRCGRRCNQGVLRRADVLLLFGRCLVLVL